MWVYRKDCELFHVGYYLPDGMFSMTETVDSKYDAQRLVHYLNGGSTE